MTPKLRALLTYATRYIAKDGKTRMVMLKNKFDKLVMMADKAEKRSRKKVNNP